MRKLNRIHHIEFNKDLILINHIPLHINDNIFEWLNQNCEITYTAESYMEKFPENKEIIFNEIGGVRIYLDEGLIESIYVSSFLPNDSRNRFEGEIIVFGKKLPKPFMSDDIEKYFPGIEIEKPPGGYWQRFRAWESIEYPLITSSKIEISMNRSPEYVGGLSLRKV